MKRLGFAIGMVLGAAAGLFLAPRRGAETRGRIREIGHELGELTTGPFRTLAEEAASVLREPSRTADLIGPCAPTL